METVKENRRFGRQPVLLKQMLGALIGAVILFSYWTSLPSPNPENASRPSVKVIRAGKKDDFIYYFGYASDLLEERLKKDTSREAESLGVAALDGYKFDYTIYSKVWKGGVGDMYPSDDGNDKVWGILYKVPKEDVGNLDKQKGVGKVDSKYKKIKVTVRFENDDLYEAVTYLINADRRSDSTVNPSQLYRKCILKGAKQARLPRPYIKYLAGIKDNGNTYKRKSIGTVCD